MHPQAAEQSSRLCFSITFLRIHLRRRFIRRPIDIDGALHRVFVVILTRRSRRNSGVMLKHNLLDQVFVDVAEIGRRLMRAAPIGRIFCGLNESVERRPRPVFRALRMIVLDRVPMQVISMMVQILFVLDRMFHEARLPYASSALLAITNGNSGLMSSGSEPVDRELCLD